VTRKSGDVAELEALPHKAARSLADESGDVGHLAKVLTWLRQSRGLAMTTLGARANVSRQHIWRIEKGLARDPGGDVLSRLAGALGVDVRELLPPRSHPAPALEKFAARAPGLGEEESRLPEGLSGKLARRSRGTSSPSSSGRSLSEQIRVGEGQPDGPDSAGDSIPDDIKVIAQFLAEREGNRSFWKHFSKEAFALKRQLQRRC
jgi:transcriptional regulator with XRE-family HTH domain